MKDDVIDAIPGVHDDGGAEDPVYRIAGTTSGAAIFGGALAGYAGVAVIAGAIAGGVLGLALSVCGAGRAGVGAARIAAARATVARAKGGRP